MPSDFTRRLRRNGMVIGLSNPKAFIILAAILLQFVDRNAGNVPLQMLTLATVPVLIGLLTDSGWGLAAGAARNWFARSPRRLVRAGQTGGAAMIGLGVSVALTNRPQVDPRGGRDYRSTEWARS